MRLNTDHATHRSASQSPSQSLNGSSQNGALSPSLAKIANGSNGHIKGESNGSPAYANGTSAITRPTRWFGHDREEVTRILIQSLTDLGYHHAARSLSRESGHELEGPTVAAFRNAVLQGDWAEAEALLFGTSSFDGGGGIGVRSGDAYGDGAGFSGRTRDSWHFAGAGGLTLAEGANKNEMLFWMRQQKYLELLERKDLGQALLVLRQELTPLHHDVDRLHTLSSLMMCSSEELKTQAQWDGAAGLSRNRLLSELSKSISPSVMIPEHRLAVLLDQVKDNWISNCLYHNTAGSPSLYVDHQCEREEFPLKTQLQLTDHTDEVWFLAFSNDGSRLATSGKDHTVIIYDTVSWEIIHTLGDHDAGVCYVAWSPDDSKLISCTRETDNCARIWDTATGHCLIELHKFDYAITAAAWCPDGNTFILGSQDSSAGLTVWNLKAERLYCWKEDGSYRVYNLALSPDGRRLVALLESRILVYDFPTREKIADWAVEDAKMTSVCVSKDNRHCLVSMNVDRIRLMDMETGEVKRAFEGHRQKDFMIRSAFGGANENFVVSGSEDSRVYIWRTTGPLVEKLEAHRPGCVNAISWHPRDPCTFASAGDDNKVRIWSRNPPSTPSKTSFPNGFHR